MLDIPKDGDYSIKSSSFEKDSAIVNLGFINTDTNAKYKVACEIADAGNRKRRC